jgi:hypothetical protein
LAIPNLIGGVKSFLEGLELGAFALQGCGGMKNLAAFGLVL